jgi:hypothetical protein
VLLHRYSMRAGTFRKIIEALSVWTVRLNQAFNEEFFGKKSASLRNRRYSLPA